MFVKYILFFEEYIFSMIKDGWSLTAEFETVFFELIMYTTSLTDEVTLQPNISISMT